MNYDLIANPAVLEFAGYLGVSENEAIGLVLRMRAFAAKHTNEFGECEYSDMVLARALGWSGSPGVWREALAASNLYWPLDETDQAVDHDNADHWQFGRVLVPGPYGGKVAP